LAPSPIRASANRNLRPREGRNKETVLGPIRNFTCPFLFCPGLQGSEHIQHACSHWRAIGPNMLGVTLLWCVLLWSSCPPEATEDRVRARGHAHTHNNGFKSFDTCGPNKLSLLWFTTNLLDPMCYVLLWSPCPPEATEDRCPGTRACAHAQ